MKFNLVWCLAAIAMSGMAGVSHAQQSDAEQAAVAYSTSLDDGRMTLQCGFCDDSACGCNSGCDTSSCDCGVSCDSGFGLGLLGNSCGCDSGVLGFGLVKKSDTCFNDFISPMTNPVFFEDPRSLSEVRFIFLNHELPGALGGNSVQVYAAQIRARLTERLSLIATKDGFIYTQSPVLDSGFADVAAGLKYNLYRDVECGRLLSVGGTYEIPSGSNKSLQGNGDGTFNFFVTGGTRIGNGAHWVSTSGLIAPVDDNVENRLMFWSNHFDKKIGDRALYVFSEVNWYNYLSSAGAFPLPVEGGDLFNLGSPGITGNDLVTGALGLKSKPASNMELGAAYEVPLTEREGLMANRFTADLIIRY